MPGKAVFQEICDQVGMIVVGENLARSAVLELLVCVGISEEYAIRYPKIAAQEITEYLDSIVRNP